MELDDLKNEWENLSNQTSHKNILTSKIINQMTHTKYNSKINKIKYPELIGGLICFIGLIFIGANFNRLDTTFWQSIGVLTIILLIILPILSFLSLRKLNSTQDLDRPYIEIIQQFANYKLRFQKYQKMNAFLCYLLLVEIITLLPKLFSDKDITINKSFWIFAFSFGYIFLLIFSKYVKRFYGKSLSEAKELMKEIADIKITSL